MTPKLPLVVCVLLTCASALRAVAEIPPLTEDQAQALAWPLEGEFAEAADRHFITLRQHTESWGNTTQIWNAQPELAPEPMPASAFAGLGSPGFTPTGTPFIFDGRFLRSSAVQGHPTYQRWVIEPVDPATGQRISPPVVVYIDRTITGATREPASGWFVQIAARAYRQSVAESRNGRELPTHAFVGAAFRVQPNPGGDFSSYFVYFGIAISIIIAIGVILAVFVAKHAGDRRKLKAQSARHPGEPEKGDT